METITADEQNIVDKQQLLDQTIVKFRSFLNSDLQIPEYLLNTNQGMQEQINMISSYQRFVNIIGKDQVSSYVSKVIINHFGLKDLTKEQQQKLNDFIELFLQIIL